MTINATAAWLLAPLRRQRRGAGRRRRRAAGHDAERHRQGVPVARHVHLPARAVAPADRRHDRLVRASTRRSGTRSTSARTTCRRRARRRCRSSPTRSPPRSACSTRCASRARSPPERFAAGVRVDLVLRQRRHPLRRGDVQAARLQRAVGAHRARALRRDRREGPALPLRRAGQLARAHRGPAREQRAAHRARDARRHAVEAGPGPRDPAPGVERGARPAPAVGPAVVVADAAGAGVRDRPARVRRPLRRLARGRGQDGRAASTRPRPSSTTSSRRAARSRRVDDAEGPARARRWPSGRAASSRATRSSSASTRSPRPSRRRSAATGPILRVDPAVEAETIADVAAWRAGRDDAAVAAALDELRRAAASGAQRDAGRPSPSPGPAAPPASGAR